MIEIIGCILFVIIGISFICMIKEYKKDKLMNPSDFEIFCIQHCKDIEEILEENQKLKQQLDKYYNEPLTSKISRIDSVVSNIYSQNKTQQKEFIDYLEDESKEVYRDGGLRQNIFKQILQKYKEIIGESDV